MENSLGDVPGADEKYTISMARHAAPIVKLLINGAALHGVRGVAESYYKLAVGIGNVARSEGVSKCVHCGKRTAPNGPSLRHLVTECAGPKEFFAAEKITSDDAFWCCEPATAIKCLRKYASLDCSDEDADSVASWWADRRDKEKGAASAKERADEHRERVVEELFPKRRRVDAEQ